MDVCGNIMMRALFSAVFVLGLSCSEQAMVELEPVYPAGVDGLPADVAVLEITPIEIEEDGAVQSPLETVTLNRGESLSIPEIGAGTWSVEVRGLDADGNELVYGKSFSFQVEPGRSVDVPFLLGRALAFNRAPVVPSDAAAQLAARRDSAAVYLETDAERWVVAAGGRDVGLERPDGAIFIIDAESYAVRKLDKPLPCRRSQATAFTVETSEGVRVVFAGGDDECPGTFDVLDPADETLTHVVPWCSVSTTTGAHAETAQSGSGLRPTGNIVVPGAAGCVVDPLTGARPDSSAQEGDVTPAAGSENVVVSAGIQGHRLLLAEGLLRHSSTRDDSDCEGFTDTAPITTSVIPGSGRVTLTELSDGRFLIIEDDMLDPDAFGWSLVEVDTCGIVAVTEGDGDLHAPRPASSHFALETGRDALLMAVGGMDDEGSPTSAVSLFHSPLGALPPTWHDLNAPQRSGTGLALTTPRAGATALRLPDGTVWVIGGANASADPLEVFIQGSIRRSPFDQGVESFGSRSPDLVSMIVLDTTEETGELLMSFADSYPVDLFSETQGAISMFLFSSSDRGVGDGLLANGSSIIQDKCEEVSIGEDSDIEGLGWTNQGEPPVAIDTKPTPSSGGSERNLRSLTLPGFFPRTGGFDASAQAAAKSALQEFAANHVSGCPWRQMLRVGLDGLKYVSKKGTANIYQGRRFGGVNLVIWVTSGDDCSQGIYEESGPLPDDPELLAELVDRCEATDNDYYFRSPPLESELEEVQQTVAELVNDPRDLILAIVGATGAPSGQCQFGQNLTLNEPRRLLGMVRTIEETGATAVEMDLCSIDTLDHESFSALTEAVSRRNLLQTCVPHAVSQRGLTDAPVNDETGAYLPIDSFSGDELAAPAQEITQQIGERCSVVYSFQDTESTPPRTRVVSIPAGEGGFYVKSNTDQTGSCGNGWWVALDERVDLITDGEFQGATIVCLD